MSSVEVSRDSNIIKETEAQKRAKEVRKTLRTVALSTVIALGGVGLISSMQKNAVEENFRPSPTEIDPSTPIEEVPLQARGSVIITYFDKESPNEFLLEVEKATVVAIKKNADQEVSGFAVSVAGNNVKRECEEVSLNGGEPVPVCKYSGVTLWINFGENSVVTKGSDDESYESEKGIGELSNNLKLGDVIEYIGAGTGYFEGSRHGSMDKNRLALSVLNGKVGQIMPRTDTSLTFVAGNIGLDNS